MLYAIFCYDDEELIFDRTPQEEETIMQNLLVVQARIAAKGKLGPVARLLPTTAATSIRKGAEPLVIDGPFAETKEQLLGFFIIDCDDLDEAIGYAKEFIAANPGVGGYEVRPLLLFREGAISP